MHLGIIALVFVVIFVAELPDKSLFASLILGSRFPARYVWLGAATAFLIHVIIAVSIGHFLTLLPHRALESVIAALFLIGAVMILTGRHSLEKPPKSKLEANAKHHPAKIFATAFTVIFIGEWGDITQITTANYAARYHDPIDVAIGATLGLWTVTAVAIIFGTKALTVVPPRVLQLITGLVLLIFAVVSIVSAWR